DSRIEQMHSGNYDAIILAVAGIKRLGIGTNLITEYLPAETFVPAPGQGALAIECRIDDEELNELLLKINNPKSEQTTLAERAFLAYFDEGESAPIGGFAEVTEITSYFMAWLFLEMVLASLNILKRIQIR